MNVVKAIIRFIAFFFLCLIIVPTQLFVLLFHKGKSAYWMPYLWHRGVSLIFGIKFKIIGKPNIDHQTLYMCNHLSYLDIPLIGSVLKTSYLAKSEVASWPVFGFLSKLQQTVFIERKRTAIMAAKNKLNDRLVSGRSMIIFPEGTSTDGQSVLPFKPSLFQLALGGNNEDLYVQPMTLKLVEVNGHEPKNQNDRDLYAWHLNMDTELHDHLWRFAKTSGARLELTFHEPLRASEYNDRKTLAKTCHDNVINGLTKELASNK